MPTCRADRYPRRRGVGLGALTGIALSIAIAGQGPAVSAAVPPAIVDETFTGSSAIAEFIGFGGACLTGAAPVAGVGAGDGQHPLAGCPTARTGPVPPTSGAPDGYLQPTDASVDQAGAVLYTKPISSADGLRITFEQWQYGGTTTPPADGISFFLVQGDTVLDAPGAFGGSLGYAQKLPDDDPARTFVPGVDDGYLGIGLDVLGNYFGDWEQRGRNCPERSPAGTGFRIPGPGQNMITVRGPGDGLDGYCLIAATTTNMSTTGPWPSTLPGALRGSLTSLPAGASAADSAALLAPSRRTVTITVTPAPSPIVTIAVDFNDGNGTSEVLEFAAPLPIPSSYQFGFAASTGFFTDVHLIRNVLVETLAPAPAPPDPAAELAAGGTIEVVAVAGVALALVMSGILLTRPEQLVRRRPSRRVLGSSHRSR